MTDADGTDEYGASQLPDEVLDARRWDTLFEVLTEIRDLLRGPVAPDVEAGVCVHPEDARVSFATFAAPHDWMCRICLYRSEALIAKRPQAYEEIADAETPI